MAARIVNGLVWGVSVRANAAFKAWGIDLSRVMQTMSVGSGVAASAGTHNKSGTETVDGKPWDYGGCIDLSLTHPTVISARADRMQLLHNGGMHGFLGAIREPGVCGWPANDALHSHWLFVGELLSDEVQKQAHDLLNGRNALVSELADDYPLDAEVIAYCHDLFLQWNPETVGGAPPPPPA